jgi:hypothetical protein
MTHSHDLCLYHENRAFGWTPPKFGHLPLIMNPDGTKLSKRQGDAFVEQLKEAGYYPEAVLSYITESGGAGERGRANRPPELQSMDSLVKNVINELFFVRQHAGEFHDKAWLVFCLFTVQRRNDHPPLILLAKREVGNIQQNGHC